MLYLFMQKKFIIVWQQFRRDMLPLIKPTLCSAGMIRGSVSLQNCFHTLVTFFINKLNIFQEWVISSFFH